MRARTVWTIALIATATFWLALFAFGAARPGYSQFTKAVSELGAIGAPHALAWNLVGFITPGLLLALCGAGIAVMLELRGGALWWLLVASGLAFAGTGVFPAVIVNGTPVLRAPSSIGHVVMLLGSGLCWLVAAVLLLRHVWRAPRWEHLRTAAVAATVLALIGLAANVFHDRIPQLRFRPGLAQRIGFLGHFLWFAIVSGQMSFAPTRQRPYLPEL
jgi:hypothetical membrane protein